MCLLFVLICYEDILDMSSVIGKETLMRPTFGVIFGKFGIIVSFFWFEANCKRCKQETGVLEKAAVQSGWPLQMIWYLVQGSLSLRT